MSSKVECNSSLARMILEEGLLPQYVGIRSQFCATSGASSRCLAGGPPRIAKSACADVTDGQTKGAGHCELVLEKEPRRDGSLARSRDVYRRGQPLGRRRTNPFGEFPCLARSKHDIFSLIIRQQHIHIITSEQHTHVCVVATKLRAIFGARANCSGRFGD